MDKQTADSKIQIYAMTIFQAIAVAKQHEYDPDWDIWETRKDGGKKDEK